jgi:hypothetical protein
MPIIKPYDTITITVDNRTQPSKVDMKTSSELPIPFIAAILNNLAFQLMQQLSAQLAAGVPVQIHKTALQDETSDKTQEKPQGGPNGNA